MDKLETKPEVKKSMREFAGEVVSAKMDKTIVVRVDTMKLNSKYNKMYRTSRKFHVHDAEKIAKEGDKVRFVECRPLSATKRWRIVSIEK